MAQADRREHGGEARQVRALHDFGPGTYLTDGRALLRVESRIDVPGDDPLVELENCQTLDTVMWPARDLLARGLRRIAVTDNEVHAPARTWRSR
jgi:hypothetical protein